MHQWQAYINLVQSQVVPALGCTEPVTVALASAKARQILGATPDNLKVKVTPNLYKNGMGVMVPGTGKAGLAIAAAAGACAGNADKGLEVLADISSAALAEANQMLVQKRVKIEMISHPDVLYTVVQAGLGESLVEVCIAQSHTHFEYIEVNGQRSPQVTDNACGEHLAVPPLPLLTLSEIYTFVTQVPLNQIIFIKRAAELNRALASIGMTGEYGLALGASLQQQITQGLLSDDLMGRAMRLGAAASDARMGGAPHAAMSNSGSGNQGIAATMPIIAFAELRQLSDEQFTRALMLSHLVAIYVKSKQNKLSALCAATTASMGAAAGLTWLLGGDLAAIHRAINAMVGDISGVFCDGAKAGCAMKVSTGAGSAVKSAILAVSGNTVSAQQGIVFDSADDSIQQLGFLSKTAMLPTDEAIIATMQHKQF
ncbi:serine dehydratase subunit alpha family protein [Agarivorans sp. Z349TD_8]|uniref:L-cysteine desulfidase family protein n=1 Tax=Agarivorans sp. Z349TD_8 TaxID=3421434 RepID=UPI003D7CD7FE